GRREIDQELLDQHGAVGKIPGAMVVIADRGGSRQRQETTLRGPVGPKRRVEPVGDEAGRRRAVRGVGVAAGGAGGGGGGGGARGPAGRPGFRGPPPLSSR